jgi:hypothetical protein
MALPRFLLPPALMLACAACTQSPPPDPARRATIPAPDDATAAAPHTAANDIGAPASSRYDCDDGSAVRVEYVAETARVELPDGRVVALPKAQSASKGGGEVFVGETVSLQRDGNDIQLHRGDGKALACRPSAGND